MESVANQGKAKKSEVVPEVIPAPKIKPVAEAKPTMPTSLVTHSLGNVQSSERTNYICKPYMGNSLAPQAGIGGFVKGQGF